MENTREKLGTRLGFILLSAGCAIGVGNVWRFPYMTGQNGGGAFVLVYLICLIVLGIPVMTMEFTLGRAAQKSPVKLYQAIEPKGSKWHIHGYASMAGNYLLMMFYTVVCGYMINFFVSSVAGKFYHVADEVVSTAFFDMIADPMQTIIFAVITILLGFFVCSFSLKNGLERFSKYMMIALLVIMVGLAVFAFTLPGASEGLKFYLLPDFNKITVDVIVAAMNQAFFTLSLGMGSMAVFGSYLGKERALMGESIRIVALDTFVALTAGLIIFPACAAYNVEPDSGASLIFITLPNIFNNMPGGRIIGSLFFLFMSFAAFSTVIAVFENIISCTRDLTGWSRKKASWINCAALLVLSVPVMLETNVLSNIHPLGGGSSISDLWDFFVSYCILPLGSLCYVIFSTQKFGFGWKKFTEEANAGKGMKVKNWMRFYCTWILPVIIFALFVIGLVQKFAA